MSITIEDAIKQIDFPLVYQKGRSRSLVGVIPSNLYRELTEEQREIIVTYDAGLKGIRNSTNGQGRDVVGKVVINGIDMYAMINGSPHILDSTACMNMVPYDGEIPAFEDVVVHSGEGTSRSIAKACVTALGGTDVSIEKDSTISGERAITCRALVNGVRRLVTCVMLDKSSCVVIPALLRKGRISERYSNAYARAMTAGAKKLGL